MKCKQCNKQWTIQSEYNDDVRFCPFCGKAMPKEKLYDLTKPEQVLSYIADKFGPETLAEQRAVGLFIDFAPSLRDDARLLTYAVEYGTYAEIIKSWKNKDDISISIKVETEKLKHKYFLGADFVNKVISWLLVALNIAIPEQKKPALSKNAGDLPIRSAPRSTPPVARINNSAKVNPAPNSAFSNRQSNFPHANPKASIPTASKPNLPEFVIYGNRLQKYNGTAKFVTIPDGVSIIGESAFANNTYIQRVTLSSSVSTIMPNAFYGCLSLELVIFPKSFQEIRSNAFWGCTKLKTILLPKTTLIGSRAIPYDTLINWMPEAPSPLIPAATRDPQHISFPEHKNQVACPKCGFWQRADRNVCFSCGSLLNSINCK